jgi:hypothetical protein
VPAQKIHSHPKVIPIYSGSIMSVTGDVVDSRSFLASKQTTRI